MRLVAWNANHNARKRSLEDNAAILEPLRPDIMVISETAPPANGNPLSAHFLGEMPGLAVIGGEHYELRPDRANKGAPPLTAAFVVHGPQSFDLLAAWPVSRPGQVSYHDVLMTALERFSAVLASGRAIMAGDLNTSARVVAQRRSHPRFVQAAAGLGLVSAYHHQTGESHGDESVATYRHGSGVERDFHIDYCFVSAGMLEAARFEVDTSRDWFAIGDHRPVVLDVNL